MTTWIAQPCGCKHTPALGAKRERVCGHGYVFQSEKAAGKPRRRSMQRKEPKRDWTAARAKVELEARCRVCGCEAADTDELDAAHIMGRKYDQPAHTGTRTLYVNPLDIVPLCPVFAPEECHRRVDAHELDLLPSLAPEEQTRAVELAGGIEAARKRLAPSAYRLEVL
jgi:hypothetical protein